MSFTILALLYHVFLQRLRKKYDTNPSKYPTLQSIVDDEIAEEKSRDSNSCTVGLLWLKRYPSDTQHTFSIFLQF